jgi:triosephosphate isomerase
MPTRRPLIAGNWKMNGLKADAVRWAEAAASAAVDALNEVAIFPPALWLPIVRQLLLGKPVALGAQACHAEAFGAQTGCVSAQMLKSAGCAYVLCGHSERRKGGETDAFVGGAVRAAIDADLVPILCVGESREDRRSGRAKEVVLRQLEAGLAALRGPEATLAVAYEPVWAIGTGETATPGTASEAHGWIRARVARSDPERAASLRILYGGSVNPDNIGSLLAAPDVDGALVGGASLDPDAFGRIVRSRPGSSQGPVGEPGGGLEATSP